MSAAGGARRVGVAVHTEHTLSVLGLHALCERYPAWMTPVAPDSPGADVVLFEPTGRTDDDLRALHAFRARPGGPSVVLLVDPRTPAVSVRLREAAHRTVAIDAPGHAIARMIMEANQAPVAPPARRGRARAVRSPSALRRYDDWFGKQAGLSRRESEVAVLCATGSTNREIADTLFIGVETVKSHLKRVYQRLQVRNRSELAALIARAARTGG